MSINPTCERCGSELKEFGALLFGPPIAGFVGDVVGKVHLCRECYFVILKEINVNLTKQKFIKLSEKCSTDTRRSSNPMDRINHPAYQEIINMGVKVVPFILEDLKTGPKWWFWALQQITGQDPVPEDIKKECYPDQLTEVWLDWGKKNGYIE